jgi:pSer/pThr/pTyr-binding forkhead associated (FHA) protein
MLRHRASGSTVSLEPEHAVGRHSLSSQRIEDRHVSIHHALLHWKGDTWTIRDLCSMCGTFLNGEPIVPGRDHVVTAFARIAFGHLSQEWDLVDDSAPAAPEPE